MPLNDCRQSAEDFATGVSEDTSQPLDVVCFGYLAPMRVAMVEEYPKADSGADILSLIDLISSDAAIASLALDRLGCRVGLISNDVGNDPDGRELLDRLKRTAIVTTASLQQDMSTPFALTIADRAGNRTWFAFMSTSLESLSTADLGLVRRADLFYVDIYPDIWQASVRAIDRAVELCVPLFVNLSDWDFPNQEIYRRLERGVSVIQKSAAGQSIQQAGTAAQTLFDRYSASLCVLTMSRHGVVYTNHSGTYHLAAHAVQVANTAGAGATFSAGLIYGRVQSWPDDGTVAFANALAALFCSAPDGVCSASATKVIEFAHRGPQPTKLS